MERVERKNLYCKLCKEWYPTDIITTMEKNGKLKVKTRNNDPHGIGFPDALQGSFLVR